MRIMRNNSTITKKGVHTMKEIIVQIIAPLWAAAIALLPAVARIGLSPIQKGYGLGSTPYKRVHATGG
jgi:hypothetical protein